MRRLLQHRLENKPQFQFTHPGRGATSNRLYTLSLSNEFQFTHPGRGATTFGYDFGGGMPKFQFTHPGRGATLGTLHHPGLMAFQFTHPGRGATICKGLSFRRGLVSIHAPREGCDSPVATQFRFSSGFQFTHPGRGATWPLRLVRPLHLRFNSRTPGGVRPTSTLSTLRGACFNSRTPGGVRLPSVSLTSSP